MAVVAVTSESDLPEMLTPISVPAIPPITTAPDMTPIIAFAVVEMPFFAAVATTAFAVSEAVDAAVEAADRKIRNQSISYR